MSTRKRIPRTKPRDADIELARRPDGPPRVMVPLSEAELAELVSLFIMHPTITDPKLRAKLQTALGLLT